MSPTVTETTHDCTYQDAFTPEELRRQDILLAQITAKFGYVIGLSIQQVAEVTAYSKATLYRMAENGSLPVKRTEGCKSMMVPVADLVTWACAGDEKPAYEASVTDIGLKGPRGFVHPPAAVVAA